MIDKLIINNINKNTPKKLFHMIILFGIISFIGGFFVCYTVYSYFLYNSLENLINNNGILIFNDNYYRFIEIINIERYNTIEPLNK